VIQPRKNEPRKPDLDALFRSGTEIQDALRAAAHAAALRRMRLGLPLIVWRDGRVVEVPPEQIPAELQRCARPHTR
jgi:hypothetical protein